MKKRKLKVVKKLKRKSKKTTSQSDGSSGYGNESLSSDIHTESTAPEKFKYKFNYYFKYYPEELQRVLQMDEIASFSVTEARFAEKISKIISSLPGISMDSTIIDATAGVGGNSMSFLDIFKTIFSVELDQSRASMLANNLTQYKQIQNPKGDFVVLNGDYIELRKTQEILQNPVDVIFIDPPWGGMNYKSKDNIRLVLSGKNISQICNEIRESTKYIVLKLPINYNLEILASEISEFNGSIILQETILDSRNREKMKIIIIEYTENKEIKESKENKDDSSASSKKLDDGARMSKFDLSRFPFNYDSKVDCDKDKEQFPVITNPDEFYSLIPEDIVLNKSLQVNKSKKPRELSLEIYQNLDRNAIINTFNYMFYKIRMGIFIYIQNNALKYFIPFQNMNFNNNWSEQIKYRDSINNFDEYIHNKTSYTRRQDDSLEMDLTKWSANNCLMGNWTSDQIGDMGWYELREILHLTCENKQINDCVFFFNRRDHPVITPNRTEPYFHIFNNLTTPLTTHKYPNYIPILSYSKNKNFADLLFPNYSDWRNVTGKIYPSS